jgi:hypothetical protein
MNTSDILARSSFGQVDWSVIGFPIEKMLGDDLSMGADADGIDIGRAGNMKPTDPSDDVLSNAVETIEPGRKAFFDNGDSQCEHTQDRAEGQGVRVDHVSHSNSSIKSSTGNRIMNTVRDIAIYLGLGLAAFIVIVAVILIFGRPM